VAVAVRDEMLVRADATERRVEVTLANGRVVASSRRRVRGDVGRGTWDVAAITPWLRALDGGP
jgi:hypothetical protein